MAGRELGVEERRRWPQYHIVFDFTFVRVKKMRKKAEALFTLNAKDYPDSEKARESLKAAKAQNEQN